MLRSKCCWEHIMLLQAHNAVASTQAVLLLMLLRTHNVVLLMLLRAHNAVL